jgi:catechol 2,3-dioxygenase-like lactoylglutathione lyase family enzyme
MDQRLTIVTLGVADLDRSRAFYLDGLGWSEVDQPSAEIVFIQMPSMVLGLYGIDDLAEDIGVPPPAGGPSMGGVTLAYNTSSEAETDEALATAVGAGAKLVKEAQKVFWGGYSGYFADPDNHLWEVTFNPFTLPDDAGSFVM